MNNKSIRSKKNIIKAKKFLTKRRDLLKKRPNNADSEVKNPIINKHLSNDFNFDKKRYLIAKSVENKVSKNKLINFKYLQKLYNKDNDFVENNFLYWIHHIAPKQGLKFIRGFDKSHPNNDAIESVLVTGYLDSDDIANDLNISKRHAARFLNPNTEVLSNSKRPRTDLENGKYFNKHQIVQLWHVYRVKNGKKVITGKGKRPRRVVSKEDYINFVLYHYNPSFTKLGKALVKDFKIKSPSEQLHLYLCTYVKSLQEHRLIKSLKYDSKLRKDFIYDIKSSLNKTTHFHKLDEKYKYKISDNDDFAEMYEDSIRTQYFMPLLYNENPKTQSKLVKKRYHEILRQEREYDNLP